MSASASITISRDGATPAVLRLLSILTIPDLTAAIGPECVYVTKKHLGQYKNRKDWPSTGYGEKMGEKVYFAPTSEGPMIVIHAQGARQIYKGGTIRPVNKRLLVFANAPESYGQTMAQMGYRKGGNKVENKRIRGLFAFAKQVVQKPHPDLIPSDETYSQTAIFAIKEAIRGGGL